MNIKDDFRNFSKKLVHTSMLKSYFQTVLQPPGYQLMAPNPIGQLQLNPVNPHYIQFAAGQLPLERLPNSNNR